MQFLIVPYKRVYNCILWRPFATNLDIVPLLVHLKLKYQNILGESATINVDLEGAKRIYQVL